MAHNSKHSGAYRFRPLTEADLPLLRQWLAIGEVSEWWGDPDEEVALIAGDLGKTGICMQIVACAGKEFAYIQDDDLRTSTEPYYQSLPTGSRSIDLFIGETLQIGRGHGSGFLRQRALQLLAAGVPLVAIDPLQANLRACRAFVRAGFVPRQPVQTDAGMVVPMFFETPLP